ncbi:MAG: Fe-S cluster assembly protein SufD [Thermoanaerobaculia bacterium]|nr:Fe-S cluster assembly protein SufD [Thermoanaerobaculia bacterium]
MTTTLETKTGASLLERRLASAIDRISPAGESERLAGLRRAAAARYDSLGVPTTRHEEWRFTNLKPIADTDFAAPSPAKPMDPATIEPYAYSGCTQLVFRNGRLDPELSKVEELPEGVVVESLASARRTRPELLDAYLGNHASFEQHPFVALNTALWQDGPLLLIPRGVIVEKPINLIFLGEPEERPVAFFPRLLIVAEESSQATVLEQYATVGEGAYLTSPVTEVLLHDNAVVDHYKLQRESIEAYHLATFQLWQSRDANFTSHSISWGGAIVRNDVNAVLDGEGGEATLNGLYMVEGTQLVDNHMRVEHAKPHCDSHELFKGILEGRARAVFNGRIYVHEGAQKTDAKQTNRNLLLSDKAVCNSNPQLEIFADDVRCTHGSTVGQLDETAIFYLRSRGIGEVAAKSLLTYAFAADIVTRIRMPAVRAELEEFLFRRLPRGEVVRQAV